MLARVHSCAVHGIDGLPLYIEVDHNPGFKGFIMVGLPDAAVRESKERVGSALKNSGFRYPRGQLVVNLAPADLRKEGSALDLPIALGMLVASEQLAGDRLADYVIGGELALDGSLRPVTGALCMALAVKTLGMRGILLPEANAAEAGVAPDIDVIPVRTLAEAAGFLAGAREIPPHRTDVEALFRDGRAHAPDFSDVKGQAQVKRALTVAAAGGHNILLIGPPGTGKTMLASRLPGILPDMTFDEALETTRVYSVAAGTQNGRALIVQRPFRAPHHTATTASIAGGGTGPQPNPGEVSLAHNGVLFLDELPEFNRSAIEVLRQPLEEGLVHIRRAMYSVTYPSRFMLVAAMNPSPRGDWIEPSNESRSALEQMRRYLGRISGPLLDRIDLHVEVAPLKLEELTDHRPSGPTSAEVRAEVQETRERQRARYRGAYRCNAHLDTRAIRTHCTLTEPAQKILEQAIGQLGFSARAYDKVLRVARTLADLDGAEGITEDHIGEAVQYRSLDRLAI